MSGTIWNEDCRTGLSHVEDGSVEIIGKTSADSDNNASYIGVYYPVE